MSFGKDLLKLLGVVAPTIATAAGGPMIGLATHTLGKILLGKDDATEDELTEFILSHQNPEVLAKIKAAEIEFETTVKKLEVDLAKLEVEAERMHVDDRISARDMTAKTKGRAAGIIATAVMAAFAVIVGILLFREVPTASQPVIYILVGTLGTSLTQVMNFYFGSSSGSKMKEQQIGEFIHGMSALGQQARTAIEVENVETVETANLKTGGRP